MRRWEITIRTKEISKGKGNLRNEKKKKPNISVCVSTIAARI